MLRQVDLDEISDGRIYRLHDIVKADCNGCVGCSFCCRNMVGTITLDPFDIYNLTLNLNKSFELLLSEYIELNISDGIILPNLKTTPEGCPFLSPKDRCTIHGFRPGLCRLFPLGRFIRDNEVHYILQIHECRYENRSDIIVHKWIGLPDMESYEKFSVDWYNLIKRLQAYIANNAGQAKAVNMLLLKSFYLNPYSNSDFYRQFWERKESLIKQLFAE